MCGYFIAFYVAQHTLARWNRQTYIIQFKHIDFSLANFIISHVTHRFKLMPSDLGQCVCSLNRGKVFLFSCAARWERMALNKSWNEHFEWIRCEFTVDLAEIAYIFTLMFHACTRCFWSVYLRAPFAVYMCVMHACSNNFPSSGNLLRKYIWDSFDEIEKKHRNLLN